MALRLSRSGPLGSLVHGRPGRWPRTRAERLRYDWALGHRRLLVKAFMACAVPGVAVLLLPISSREFLSGVFFASGGWLVAGLVQTFSGATGPTLGEAAEGWSADELDVLRRRGWRIAHAVRLRTGGDVDHVALGSGGLLVIETKWSSDGWAGRFAEERLARAADQASRNAHDLRRMFPRVQPVTAVVVAWGPPAPDERTGTANGLPIVAGNDFSAWLRTFAEERIEAADPMEVEAAWGVLVDHQRRRDGYDEGRLPAPVSLDRSVNDVMIGGLAGFALVFLLALATGAWFLPLSWVGGGLLWRLRRRSRRELGVGVAAVTVGLLPLAITVLVFGKALLRTFF